MKFTQQQFDPILRSLKYWSVGGAITTVLLLATTTSGQDSAPSYAPGSVNQDQLTSVFNERQSDAFELEDWSPPVTNAQAPASTEWVPPATEVASPVTQTEQAFPLIGDDNGIQLDQESPSDDLSNEVLIAPPVDFDDTADQESPSFQAPSLNLDEPAVSNQLVPFADIEQSAVVEEPSSVIEPSQSQTDFEVDASPAIPQTAELVGDELIEFDGDCLECESAQGQVPMESVEGEVYETYGSESASVGHCGCGIVGCAACARHAAGPRRNSIVSENIGSRTVAAGKNVVSKTLGAGRNVLGTIHTQRGNPHVVTPVRNVLGGISQRLAGNEEVYAVGQLSFLSFSRDYRGRGRQLTFGVPNLFANGPDEGDFFGVDVSYGRRRAGGTGWEARYIGFNPDSASDFSGQSTLVYGGLAPPLNDPATFGGFTDPSVPQTFGLSGIGLNGFSAADVFNSGLNSRVTRDSEFGSFEFNLLRAAAGGGRLTHGSSVIELFGGLRGVSFRETTTFSAGAVQIPSISSAFYESEVQNSLFGLQVGGRLEKPIAKGWGWTFGTRVGIYNNRIENRQRAQFVGDDGSRSTPVLLFGENAGREFDFEGTDNELAFLGELDFGVTYQFRQATRARVGFRGIAVTNVADSAGQLEDSLFDVDLISQPEAFQDLIVGGFYFGVDHAF